MKEVSRRYKTAMKKPFRNRSHCVVTFGNTDITAITDGMWNANVSPQSSFSTLDYEHEYGDTIGFLELNRWSLDGKTEIGQANKNDGFISSLNNISTIIKRFSKLHSFSGIALKFDSREDEYPFEVTVAFYNGYIEETLVDHDGVELITSDGDTFEIIMAESSGTGLVAKKTVYPKSKEVTIDISGENVNAIVINFNAMLPNRRARLEKVTWGVSVIYNDNQLANVKQSHDVDPISRRLPTEKMDVTIFDYQHLYDPDNPQGIYNYINKGTPITVSYGMELDDGTIEWTKHDTYSLVNTPSFKNEKVTFNTVGLIQTLNGKYYKAVNGSKSLYSIAEDVLEDALANGYIYPMADGSYPWNIDSTLQSMYTDYIVPIDTYANILQMVAHAARCRLFTSDDNVIFIKPFGVTPVGVFNGKFTDNGSFVGSEWGTVDYGTESSQSMGVLELNRFVLDGSAITSIQQEGFISNDFAEDDGDSAVVFGKRFDVSHDLPIITISFDTLYNDYPFELEINYYAGSQLIKTEIGYPTSSVFEINTEFVSDCDSVEIYATSMMPGRRVRVSKMSFRETDFAITLNDTKENQSNTSKIEKLRNIVVNQYHYEANGSSSELFNKQLTLTEEQVVHIEYPAAINITVNVSGGTALEKNIYAQATDIKLSAGTYTIVATGTTLTQKATERTIEVNTSGNDDIESNPMITNDSMATALGDHIKAYLQLRNTYDEAYRGNPELEVGDIIELETMYSNVVYGLVLVDEITYNGALSGKVKVKGLV